MHNWRFLEVVWEQFGDRCPETAISDLFSETWALQRYQINKQMALNGMRKFEHVIRVFLCTGEH